MERDIKIQQDGVIIFALLILNILDDSPIFMPKYRWVIYIIAILFVWLPNKFIAESVNR